MAESVLLGAVVASTDAGFRNAQVHPYPPTAGANARGGDGLNDPVAIALTIGLIAWIEEPEL